MSTDDPFRASRDLYSLLEQGEVWVPRDKPAVRISDMDPAWRYNTARFLTRNARAYVPSYELGEHLSIWGAQAREVLGEVDGEPRYGQMVRLAPSPGSMAESVLERELDDASRVRSEDPEAWIETTPLYRALVDGLPDNAGVLAKHWSDCSIRTEAGGCTCWQRHLRECPKRTDINETCRCLDFSPEWTL